MNDSVVRRCIALSMMESLHMFWCVVTGLWFIYMCNGGNPSGNDGTTIVNTVSNEGAVQLAWLDEAPVNMKDLYYYNKNVRTIIYGDDNVINLTRDAAKFFSAAAIQRSLLKYGMKYGPANKVDLVGEFIPLAQCSFLKNTTGEFFGWKVPLMELSALVETVNWIRQDKNSPEPEQACEDNCNAVLRNLVFYGEKTFNYYRNSILREKPTYKLLVFRHLKDEFLQVGSIGDPYNDNGWGMRSENRNVIAYDHQTLRPIQLEEGEFA
jgi:hypothetical protein